MVRRSVVEYPPEIKHTMTYAILVNFLLYCVINAFTPGPGNLLALNTVTNYGYRRGRPLFLGIFLGYYAVQTTCGLVVWGLGAFNPIVLGCMKYIGAAYILWLTIHIALNKPQPPEGAESASFMKGFLLQFLNVKIYIFGITALTCFITPHHQSLGILLGAEYFIATLGTVATLTWIGFGLVIQRFYLRHFRVLNILMALTLLECIWSMLAP